MISQINFKILIKTYYYVIYLFSPGLTFRFLFDNFHDYVFHMNFFRKKSLPNSLKNFIKNKYSYSILNVYALCALNNISSPHAFFCV